MSFPLPRRFAFVACTVVSALAGSLRGQASSAASAAPSTSGTSATSASVASEPPTELAKFILTEGALAQAGDLLPTSRPSDSVLGWSASLLDTPRAVTVLTPELLQKLGVRDFADLERVSAGAMRPNYYGVPGAPLLRGDFAGTFFNGMQRAWQRNEMPMSFGSLEGLDIVKGPAPGNLGATQAGGYVNFLPKSPYYDRARGSLRVTAGTYDYFNAALDLGGPFLAFGRPAAYRVSLTAQDAGAYARNIGNDYLSLYGALKARLADGVSLFAGAEYYRFHTNENAGWNRITQDLIDNGNYIVGEVRDATSAAAGGFVLPGGVPFIPVFGAATPGSAAFDTAGAAIIAPANYRASLTPALRALLGPNGEYTSAFFNAGGRALTTKLDRRTVLADPADFADSRDLLVFADLVDQRRRGLTLKNQFIVDWLETDKRSSYGYAYATEQIVLEDKITAEHALDAGLLRRLVYGGSLRYQWAHQLQDFSAEPFSRRDISAATLSPNSIVLTGSQRPLTGDTRNLWAQGDDTELTTLGLFAVGEFRHSERFATTASLRVEGARFEARTPGEFERSPTRGRQTASGGKNYYSASLSPLFKLTPTLSLYGTAQHGTALNASQGGTVTSEDNFGETELAELGAKASLLDGRLFASFAAYYATLARFNSITANPYGLRTKGLEVEATWVPSRWFSVIGNFGVRRTVLTHPLGFRFAATQDYYMPLLAGGLYADFGDNNGLLARNNPDTILAGSPETVASVVGSVELPAHFTFALGPTFRGAYWHNFEHTLRMPSSLVWNGTLAWRHGRIAVLLEGTNVFNEDWFYGSDPMFAANTIVTKAPLREAKLSVTYAW
ncbi:MAG: TonB-dependent receptor plug domain-containing protein [Verrucomicrobiota bacterium]